MPAYPSFTLFAFDSLHTLPCAPQSSMARSCSEVAGRATALDQQMFEVKCEVQVR